MEENNVQPVIKENRNEGEKHTFDAYPVNKIDLDSRHIIDINYSGTPVLTTKEMITELTGKANKVGEVITKYNELVQGYREAKEQRDHWNREYKELDEATKLLMKKAEEWKAENERLKRALELEKKGHLATAEKLAKFQQVPPQKKAYLSEAEISSIQAYIVQAYQEGRKVTAKEIHEWVAFEGRKRGDRRLAQISYETVRATVSKIKANLGI